MQHQERLITFNVSGWVTVFLSLIMFLCIGPMAFTDIKAIFYNTPGIEINALNGIILFAKVVGAVLIPMLLLASNQTLQRNQAIVYTFMGKYVGTLKGPTYLAIPFWWSGYPKISLSVMTIEVPQITVNDKDGNPIIIACNIFAHVSDTSEATFGVLDFYAYLKSKGEVALRSIAKNYPMDAPDETTVSLRGSSNKIMEELAREISAAYGICGVVLEKDNPVALTSLNYAPEMAQAMLQRQQAKATVEARETITEGAVQIVKHTIKRLQDEGVVSFDEDHKSKLVSGLLITLVSNHGASPVFSVK